MSISLNPLTLIDVKVLLTNYTLYSADIQDINNELAMLQFRQDKTRQDLSKDIELVLNNRASILASLRNVKINLSNYGIKINET